MLVKLKILASDIMEADYFNCDDCPITRALKRAGLEGYRDTGTQIDDLDRNEVVINNPEAYSQMADKVIHMNNYKKPKYVNLPREEPADFEVELDMQI